MIFLGSLKERQIEEELTKSKYLVLASKREAFGLVVIEAMAKGVVPIVSDGGGKKYILNNTVGAVFKQDDSSALISILNLIGEEDESNYLERSFSCYEYAKKFSESNCEILKILTR